MIHRLRIRNLLLFMALILFYGELFEGNCLADDTLSQVESIVLSQINQARLDPVGTTAQLGIDATLIEDLVGISMEPLLVNSILQATSTAHSMDMLAQGYFSKTTPTGEGFAERIDAAGYDGDLTGEAIAVITFRNFIEPQMAAELLFKQLLAKEAAVETPAARMLYNPQLQDVGIGIQTGALKLGGSMYNAYVATVDLGVQPAIVPDTVLIENWFLTLLNQARWETQEPDRDGMRREVSLDRIAAETLAAWSEDEDIRTSIEEVSFDDETTLPDFDGFAAGSLKIFRSTHVLEKRASEKTQVEALFADLIVNTGDDEMKGRLADALLGADDSLGLAMDVVAAEENGLNVYYLRVIWIIGKRDAQQNGSMMGIVYKDLDSDGRYSIGEEAADQSVIIYGAGIHLKSDAFGRFGAQVAPGHYLIVLFQSDGTLNLQELYHGQDNTWVPLPMSGWVE